MCVSFKQVAAAFTTSTTSFNMATYHMCRPFQSVTRFKRGIFNSLCQVVNYQILKRNMTV